MLERLAFMCSYDMGQKPKSRLLPLIESETELCWCGFTLTTKEIDFGVKALSAKNGVMKKIHERMRATTYC